MLKNSSPSHITSAPIHSNSRAFQQVRSIQWNNTNGVLLWDEFDVDKIAADGTVTHFIDYNAGTDYAVYAICDDGVNAYWATRILDAGVDKTVVYKKALTGTTATSPTEMFKTSSVVINKGVMEYVKDRIVLAINNSIYEISSLSTSLPTALYTHSDTDVVFTSITASGPAGVCPVFTGVADTIGGYLKSLKS